MKWYRILLLCLGSTLFIIGLLGMFDTLTLGVHLASLATLVFLMIIQINTASNRKRRKLFWALQLLFFLGLTVFIGAIFVRELSMAIGLPFILFFAISMLAAIFKTGQLEKRLALGSKEEHTATSP